MPRASTPRVYVDAPIYFNVIKRERGLWPDSLKVLLAAERGDIRLVASTLLHVEVSGVRGDIDAAAQDDIIDRFLESDLIEWRELDRFTSKDARRMARQHNLRGADAAHLATAVRAEADYFVSRDRKFPYGQSVGGTQIIFPGVVWNPTFDDMQVDMEAMSEDDQSLAAEKSSSGAAARDEASASVEGVSNWPPLSDEPKQD